VSVNVEQIQNVYVTAHRITVIATLSITVLVSVTVTVLVLIVTLVLVVHVVLVTMIHVLHVPRAQLVVIRILRAQRVFIAHVAHVILVFKGVER
jgi:hypothetical protein